MSSTSKTSKELHVAEQIVSVLPEGSVVRVCSDDRESIRFAVRSAGLRLRQVVFSRPSLRKLIHDPVGSIKIEYLQRDLRRDATRQLEFRYPREVRRGSRTSGTAAGRAFGAIASVR